MRAFSAAGDAAGEAPPPLGQASGEDAWSLVVMGDAPCVLEPSDPCGRARAAPRLSAILAAGRDFGDGRAAVDVACPEFVKAYRKAAALAERRAKAKSRKALSKSRRNDLDEQTRSPAVRYVAAKNALERRLRSSGWVSTNGQGLRRP